MLLPDTHVYRGRFAPTPSGPMHFGSLTTAVGSYLQAKKNNGEWLVRIEDIDPPRVMKGSADSILYCLEKYGFQWDGPVIYQSHRSEIYEDFLQELLKLNLVYLCSCSRKAIAEVNAGRLNHSRYPGTCRSKIQIRHGNFALRIITDDVNVSFVDAVLGHTAQNLYEEVGDFIIKRTDGYYAYHLAVVVDDYCQGISEIVRGGDLLDSTHRQIYLQQVLGLRTPRYAHLPLVLDKQGNKMSKQNIGEKSLLNSDPVPLLIKALGFLGQQPLDELLYSSLSDVWSWAIENWNLINVPKIQHRLF